jgi:hypothetical protein
MLDLRPTALSVIASLSLCSLCAGQTLFSDQFDQMGSWTVRPSDGVEATASLDADAQGKATSQSLKVDYAFKAGAGYFIIRVPLNITLPANYEVSFSLRSAGKANNFECKLVDGSINGVKATPEGDDVWWVNTRNMPPSEQWSRKVFKQRKFSFAWGPGGGKAPLTKVGALEFAIAAGEGGTGQVWIDDLEIRELPVAAVPTTPPVGSASTKMCEMHDPTNLFDNDDTTAWQCEPNEVRPWYQIDFGVSRELGGLSIEWEKGYWPESVEVKLSDDAATWTTAAQLTGPLDPQRAFVRLPDAQARYVRLEMPRRAKASAVGIQTLSIEPPSFGDSANAMLARVASSYPRGGFPRSLHGEQIYWTVAGVPGDHHEVLVSEDGQIELAKSTFMIEPFVLLESQNGVLTQTWENSKTTREQAEKVLPLPIVTRRADPITMRITTLTEGAPTDSAVIICYELTNTSAAPVKGTLHLALRPLQVLPPWHELNITGGAGNIHRLAIEASDVLVNGEHRVTFHAKPDRVGLTTFAEAPCAPLAPVAAGAAELNDSTGLATAVTAFDFTLGADKSQRWWVTMPLHGSISPKRYAAAAAGPDEYFRKVSQSIAGTWVKILARTKFQVPPEVQPLVNTWYSTTANVLINMDGQAIQPGSRTYERSWMRDGCLTSSALLEAGYPEVVKSYLAWYSGFQYDFGKVPCVVDRRGPDPVDENDSTGQFIFALMNYYRYTGDEKFLRAQFPRINKAVEYIQYMRAMRMTKEFEADSTTTRQEPGKPAVPSHAFYGLVPQSISHEGYSAKPMHSYWDCFFTLRGLKDAVEVANSLGETAAAERWTKVRDEFARDLAASIELTRATHGISYIPGCVELGDFDSTSTTVAIWPAQAESILQAEALNATFDRYWKEFKSRRDEPATAGEAFTPYELRHVGALIRMGRKNQALDAMDWYLKQQRPAGWHQWQEVVWKDERTPRFIGDSPHTWCGSDFMNSFRTIFIYEREADASLVLFAGVPESWVRDKGVAFENLPTPHGKVSARVIRDSKTFTISIVGDAKAPKGGICVTCPSEKSIRRITINGENAVPTAKGEAIVRELPATVVFETF